MRRVAYVVNSFPKLSETFIAEELAEVVGRGIDVRILSLRRDDEELRHLLVERAGLIERTHYGTEGFYETMTTWKPDLIHAHFATRPAAAARRLSIQLGIPFTFTAHRYDIYDRPPEDFDELARLAGAVVTVSAANVEYLNERWGIDRSHIQLIPCGVDTERLRPAEPASPPEIVCVARLKPFKNHRVLLLACELLVKRGLDFRCIFVGDGPERDSLLELRAGLGLDGVVELAGPADQDEVGRRLSRATIAALPSLSEGAPVCLMEAASCGLPAVATRVGGIPELIRDGVTGLVVTPDDVEDFAGALESLLRAPAAARRMGMAARHRAEELFSVRRQVDALTGVWRRCLQGAPAV